MPETAVPSSWILVLLWPFKGESSYQQILGDLYEEFDQRKEHGMPAARRWFFKEVLRNLWAMICRPAMILVAIVPFLCVLSSDVFHYVFIRISISYLSFSLMTVIGCLVIPAAVGLLLGILGSRMMRGHERLVRLSFGIYQVMYFCMTAMTAQVYGPSPAINIFLLWILYCRPICSVVFFWIGSNWMERQPHRRFRAAR